MTRELRVVLVLTLAALGMALGQNQHWTVQTVAHRDYRDAQKVASNLEALGFDAYTEFAMDRGRQFVRVRIGCFASRAAASTMATVLGTSITAEAVPVPMSPDAVVAGCVKVDVGFRKPAVWRQIVGRQATFEVEVAGSTATIVHTGLGWQVNQGRVGVPEQPGTSASDRFVQVFPNGVPMVQVVTAAGPVTVCAGRLLDAVAHAAIVEQESAVVACALEPYTVTSEMN